MGGEALLSDNKLTSPLAHMFIAVVTTMVMLATTTKKDKGNVDNDNKYI